LNLQGVDSIAWMQQLAGRMDRLSSRAEIESALDDIEYLMEALDPELQESAYQLIDALRDKLEALQR
jgi:ABC-type transporter Mla subunit MlaD